MKSLLSRFTNSAADYAQVSFSGDDEPIVHPADYVVVTPAILRPTADKGKFGRVLAFAGFGRSLRQSMELKDTNNDGECIVSVKCHAGIECSIRRPDGSRAGVVDAGDERVVNFNLPAGAYNIFWKEV